MTTDYEENEVDKFYPNSFAIQYYENILSGLLFRVERVKEKIAKLKEKQNG